MIPEVMVPYLDVPVFSAVLLVISGILIANALWYMWHEEPNQPEDGFRELRRQNEHLQTLLEQQRETSLPWEHPVPAAASASSLPEHVKIAWEQRQPPQDETAPLTMDQQEPPVADSVPPDDRLEVPQQMLQQLQAQLELQQEQAERLEQQKGESLARLEEESAARRQLETQLQQVTEKVARLKAGAETLQSLRTEQGSLHAMVQGKEMQLRNVTAERDDAVAAVVEARQTVANLRVELKHQRETSDRLRSERDGSRAELESQQFQREALVASLEEHAHAIEQYQIESRGTESLRQEQARLRTAHAEAVEREQRAIESLQDLQRQIPSLERTNQILKRHAEKVSKRLRRTREQRASLAVTLRNTNDALQEARQETRVLRTLREELATVEKSLQESLARLRHAEAERDEAKSTEVRAKQIIGHMQEELTTQQEQLEQLVRDQEQTLAALQRERLDRARADAAYQAEQESFASHWDNTSGDADTAAAKLREERDRAVAAQTEAQVELTRLRALLQDRERTLEEYRQLAVEPSSPEDSTEMTPVEGGQGRHDPRLGWVYLERPDVSDDLSQISGVADVLIGKLNQLGVYTYKQIMEWDATAIEEFSRRLEFKDRIQRDDWVGQARRLHEQHRRRAA